MTDSDKIAAMREAVGAYGDSLRECPVKYRGNGGAFCSLCGATPGHNCGLEIDAGFKLVKLVQHLTDPEPARSMPPAAPIDALHALADRMGTSANQPHETVKAHLERQCYEASAKIANAVAEDLRHQSRQWTVDRMPAAAKDALNMAEGADMVRQRLDRMHRICRFCEHDVSAHDRQYGCAECDCSGERAGQ